VNEKFQLPESKKNSGIQLPFSRWWPVLAGLLVGFVYRFIFSATGIEAYSTMNVSFIGLVPMAVGAITVFLAERHKRRSWTYYCSAPALPTSLLVLGTLLLHLEGIICALLITPLFVVLSALGGLLMGAICRFTNWPKASVLSIAILPALLGGVEQFMPLPDAISVVSSERVIDAPPHIVWQQLVKTEAIQADEIQQAWMYRIGVPLPLEGITREENGQQVRQVRMGKGIEFVQRALEWELEKRVIWNYEFSENSFPARALDDHVKIGGDYFDLIDTEYSLQPLAGEQTRLRASMSYRVSTHFNWYAKPIAQLLIGNFEKAALKLYTARAERQFEASRRIASFKPEVK